MIRIYVAGAIGQNDSGRLARIHAGIAAGHQLRQMGFAPFIPHLGHYWDELHPGLTYEDWMAYDAAFLATCHALLRIPGKSPGADREVAQAASLKIPVFHDVDTLFRAFSPIAPF